ncbi:hypothetical protein VTO42DRAFT_1372 [Malbranchea cinnamomea]
MDVDCAVASSSGNGAKEYASERPEDRSTDESAAMCNAGTYLWRAAFLIAVPETSANATLAVAQTLYELRNHVV